MSYLKQPPPGTFKRRYFSYPVFLADPARILEIPGPGQTQGPTLKITVCEHVRQAVGVIVLLCNKLDKF